jgi:peptidyl-prolyl cis-trans isomerase B (cyclophilin B)
VDTAPSEEGTTVSPNARARAYEKRRYEKWQAKQQERLVQRRRRQRLLGAAAGALAVIAVIGAAFMLLRGDDSSSTSATPAATPSAPVDNACPAVDVKPPATPKKFAKVPPKSDAAGKTFTVTLATTCGNVAMTLDGTKAPQAVSSLVFLAKQGFFDGSKCHRLTTEGIYVLQCGDPTGTGTGGPGYEFGPVENAPKDAVYPAGTVAMARAQSPDSQGSQFFLVYKDSTIAKGDPNGYTVMGKIASGLDVVTKVAAGGTVDGGGDGAPKRAVSIRTTTVAPG